MAHTVKPSYEELIAFLQRLDHALAHRDTITYTDELANELEELLIAAEVHYDVLPVDPPGHAIPYKPTRGEVL